jgi:hypothetical protein
LISCVAVSVTGCSGHQARRRIDYLGIAEIAGSGIAGAAERDRANVASFRERASARITAALGLKHSVGSPAATPRSDATTPILPRRFFAVPPLEPKSHRIIVSLNNGGTS